jgi:hypothetical protein
MQILDQLVQWVEIHPDYGLLLTFIMAFAESLIVVGGLIPGSLAITGIGILAGSGILNVYSTFICAILGAIIGDTSSFLIGRHFKENLKNLFIFKKYPSTLRIGKHYFEIHGGKSVFFGRFIGPIRAVVPAIAGMMNMPLRYFVFANVLSAIGWSALFFIPGVLIGKGHEHIKSNFTQFLIGLFVILSPFLVVKILQRLKLSIFKHYGNRLIIYFKKVKTIPFLDYFIPSHRIHPYFKTLTEFSYFTLILIAGLISILLSNQIMYLFNCLLPLWIKHRTHLGPLFQKTSFLNDHLHLLLLTSLFTLFIFITKNFRLFWSLLIISGFGLIFDFGLNISNHIELNNILEFINPFIFSIAIQYLWLRILVLYKPKLYFTLMLFVITAWNLDTLYLSIHDQLPWLEYIFAGLLAGQISWIYSRLSDFKLKYADIWLMLMILEMFFQFLI